MSFSKTTVNSDLTKCGACLLTGASLPMYFYLCFVLEDDTSQQFSLSFYFFLRVPLASDVSPMMSEVTEGKSHGGEEPRARPDGGEESRARADGGEEPRAQSRSRSNLKG